MQIHDKHNMDAHKEEQLARLVEMFGERYARDYILSVLLESDWNERDCVERLLSEPAETEELLGAAQQAPSWSQVTALAASLPTPVTTPQSEPKATSRGDVQLARIYKRIDDGVRLLVLMRGLPGSGKSTLARQLILDSPSLRKNPIEDYIFSTDQFFSLNPRSRYEYQRERLPEAHEWNRMRVLLQLEAGWSPIIVDNTNLRLEHMLPYARAAVAHGYTIELLEPRTPWRYKPGQLEQRNVHNVSKLRIAQMQQGFEPVELDMLLKLCVKAHAAGDAQPLVPSVKAAPVNSSKPQREKFARKEVSTTSSPTMTELSAITEHQLRIECSEESIDNNNNGNGNGNGNAEPPKSEPVSEPESSDNNWQALWQGPTTPIAAPKPTKRLLELLRDEVHEESCATEPVVIAPLSLQRHSLGCPLELPEFKQLREVYTTCAPAALWDLYVRCNGDMEYCAETLGQELDDRAALKLSVDVQPLADDDFTCDCLSKTQSDAVAAEQCGDDDQKNKQAAEEQQPAASATRKLKNRRAKRKRQTLLKNDEAQPPWTSDDFARELELNFAMPSDYEKLDLQRMRVLLNGSQSDEEQWRYAPHADLAEIFGTPESSAAPTPEPDPGPELAAELTSEEDDVGPFCEYDLGTKLVEQLRKQFGAGDNVLPVDSSAPLRTKIQLPATLAKQVYLHWLESCLNQLEQENDEKFAKYLALEQYADCENVELIWQTYDNEQLIDKVQAANTGQETLANILTKMKLCEMFAHLPEEIVHEEYAAQGCDYERTVIALGGQQGAKKKKPADMKSYHDKANQRLNQLKLQNGDGNNNATEAADNNFYADAHQFEHFRNRGSFHRRWKAECERVAELARQAHDNGLSDYFTMVGQLHATKMVSCNQRAANSIRNIHGASGDGNGNTLSDTLDLHYFQTDEALEALDMFLDWHIMDLSQRKERYRNLHIITGRGNHSANGVSRIRTSSMRRLKQRGLHCQHKDNPGLLRVRVYNSTRRATAYQN